MQAIVMQQDTEYMSTQDVSGRGDATSAGGICESIYRCASTLRRPVVDVAGLKTDPMLWTCGGGGLWRGHLFALMPQPSSGNLTRALEELESWRDGEWE